jgi:hypothetical protein
MELTPIEKARATLGEHYEHFIIITATDNEYDVCYNNVFAANGMLVAAQNSLNDALASAEEDLELIWEEEEEDEEDDTIS